MNYDLGTVMKAVFSPETYVSTLKSSMVAKQKASHVCITIKYATE
jgi:hypothetical protein